MSRSEAKDAFNLKRGAAVLLTWLLAALTLLLLVSLAFIRFPASARLLAWAEAAVCFLAAAAAGRVAGQGSEKRLLRGLAVGLALCLVLPGLGFLIDADRLNRDALLSTVSFSLSGALFGAVVLSGGRSRRQTSFSGRRAHRTLH